jgi:DNA-binding GntR family transcriptional regulator
MMTVVGTCVSSNNNNTSWDRLHDILLNIKPGDTVTSGDLVGQTGLSPAMVQTVLEALARAELFERTDDGVFVRRSLWGPPV